MKKNLRLLLLTVLGCWMAGSAWAEDHYLVGGCTASGWESGDWQRSPVAMVNVADNVWVWAGKLTVGDGDNGRFKIPNSGGGWDGYWAPEQGTVLGTEEKDLSTSSEGDNKYCVAEEGIYKVTINTSSLKIKAEKLTEPSKDGDYYLISSVADYYWFAGKVTSEGGALKARLTADLNFAEAGFFPLACDKFKFKGEFDGAGHTISNAVIIGSNNNVAFARYASDGANIHDFVIEGSFTGNAKVGGIIGFARDGGEVKLANIINKASVQATGNTDANAAALVGCATDGTKITALNCANLGSVSGQDGQCAAFAGWTQSGTTFTNCWNNGTINNIDGTSQLYRNSGSVTAVNCYDLTGNEGYNQGEKLAASTLTTGELCYKLNGDQSVIGWRQNLTGDDADQIPVPFSSHAQVYANGTLKCDGTSAGGELTYANESSSVIPPHSYENGWCSVCGAFDKEYLTADEDGFFSIGTANDLHWFATFVDKENQAAKAKLTANIDYSEFKQGFIGGSQAAAFSGVFDGQGKTITIDIVNDGTNRTGLFAYIKSATIKNLAVEGSATSAGNNCVGGLGGRSDGDGTLIENVVVKTAVSYTGSNGDATCGGFFANMEAKVTLRNCAFYGSINTGTSEGNGGLVGWAGGGTNSVYENCIVAPTSYTKNGNSADFARNNPTTTNCVKLEGDDARLATGEMTYILNGNQSENVKWYQKLGAEGDAHPMPFGTDIVYANGSLDCAGNAKEGTTVTYSNTDGSTRDEHQFTDGFCSACGQVDLNYIAATDGAYNLASAKDVKWFAALVNSGSGNANARLTADVDFADVTFTGIGNGSNHFTGTFDGQGHIVKNMVIDQPEESNIGFFNEIDNGAVIKNFTIDASCSVKGKAFTGAFVGHVSGNGTALLECLGNEGSVETVNQNAGALVGCNTSGELKLTIKNCYNAGAIKSANEAGGLSGWFGNDAITVNCYNMGTVAKGESYARGNNIQITNCFDAVTSWPALNKVNIEDFTNGVVYAKLSEAAPTVWYLSAAEGGHPVLYKTQWGGPANAAIANAEAFEGHTTNALKQALADAINAAKLAVASGDDDAIAAKLGDMSTALAAAKALDITVLEQTMALAEEGVDLTDANDFIANGTTADELNNVLYRLRTARKINALTTTDIYQGSAPKAGKVYIYNVGTGLFLGTGSNWNTHTAVDQVGIEIELVDLEKPETNNFKFRTGRGAGWLAYNGYVDTDGQDIWHFLPVDGKEGVYNISSTGNDGYLLGYDPNAAVDGILYWNNIAIDRTGLDNPMNQWKVITAEERAALLKAASEENPVDVSYLIKNASLNRQDGYDDWTKACDGGNGGARVSSQTYNNNGDCAADYAWEYYNPNTFSFTQNLTGLKAGNYMVMVQGFFRNGDGKAQADAVNNEETLVQLPYLVANQQQALLPNIADEAGLVPGIADMMSTAKGDFPNMPASALEFFEHGAYWTVVEVEVGTDGLLTIGVKKDEKQLDGDWTVFDNFRLIYLGNPALETAKSDLATLIQTAKGLDTTGKTEESVSALNTAISDAETALAAEDATVESLTTAKTNLQTAINNLADIVNGINAIESAAQAGKAFNMQGQQVKKAQKGVYIINNKKVVVK